MITIIMIIITFVNNNIDNSKLTLIMIKMMKIMLKVKIKDIKKYQKIESLCMIILNNNNYNSKT